MAEDLKQYLAEHQCKGFKPVPHYFASGDYATFFARDEPCFAERVDDLLTVYLAFDNKELVGCKVKGIRHILDTAGSFGVAVDGGDVKLGLLFFVGAATAKNEAQRRRYEEVGRIAGDAAINRRELEAAATG